MKQYRLIFKTMVKTRNVLSFIFIIGFLCSCGFTGTRIIGNTYLSNDSIKLESFEFLNDSICIYKQEFQCDIEEKFRKTTIDCIYKIHGNRISFKSKSYLPDHLISSTCYRLPDSIINKCHSITQNTKYDPFIIDYKSGWTKANVYGYINNIDGDTLTITKRSICYKKINTCFDNKTEPLISREFHVVIKQ